MSEDMVLGTTASESSAASSEPYVITNDAGEVIDRPITRLNPSEQNLARSFENATAFSESPALVERFVRSTGVVEGQNGQPRIATFRALAWLVGLKNKAQAKGSTLVAFDHDEDGTATGKALAIREYTCIPSTDLHTEEGMAVFNDTGTVKFRVVPLISLSDKAPVKANGNVDLNKVKPTAAYPVDRLPFKNVVVIDYTKEADGSVLPVRARATFYLRVQFLDRSQRITAEAANGNTVERPARLHASVTPRAMYDVTDEFLGAYAKAEGKTVDDKVQAAIRACYTGVGRLGQCLQLQGRSAVAAMVSSIDYASRRANNLDDRVRMYAFEGMDGYFGIEQASDAGNSEFTDFHMRLVKLADPLTMHAQRLQGVKRINAGTNVVLSQ